MKTKNLAIIIFIHLSIIHLIAQPQPRSQGLKSYEGIWEYRFDDIVFIVGLKCVEDLYSIKNIQKNPLGGCLIGGYSFKTNTVNINCELPPVNQYDNANFEFIPIYASNARNPPAPIDTMQLHMFFWDCSLNKHTLSNKITCLSKDSIRWQLFENEGDYFELPPQGFSVPSDVILVRVKE